MASTGSPASDGQRLAGKTCLVTAAGQGIGREIAVQFAGQGARVIAVDLRFSDGDDALSHPQIVRRIQDVSDATAVAQSAAEFPDVSVLVNGVGFVTNGSILNCSLEEFDRSMDLNVRTMAMTCRAFLPAMLARRQGSIINIASVVSCVMAAPNRFAYGTSKAAVIGLTQSIARDFIADGIRCNAISPGTVDTPSLHQRFAATGDPEAARASFVARQPMGRLGRAEEVAAVAVLLASDEASFMTGANIVIDGGMSL